MIIVKPLPSLEYLNECFTLSEESPSGLVWKTRPQSHFPTYRGWLFTNANYAGKSAGNSWEGRKGGLYYQVKIADRIYLAHRIVYAMHYKVELSTAIEVDHRDTNSLNNLPSNLRQATRGSNQHNAKLRKNNTTGVKGVYYRKDTGMWRGIIMRDGARYDLGHSLCKDTMEQIVREFREKLHKEFCNHGN